MIIIKNLLITLSNNSMQLLIHILLDTFSPSKWFLYLQEHGNFSFGNTLHITIKKKKMQQSKNEDALRKFYCLCCVTWIITLESHIIPILLSRTRDNANKSYTPPVLQSFVLLELSQTNHFFCDIHKLPTSDDTSVLYSQRLL